MACECFYFYWYHGRFGRNLSIGINYECTHDFLDCWLLRRAQIKVRASLVTCYSLSLTSWSRKSRIRVFKMLPYFYLFSTTLINYLVPAIEKLTTVRWQEDWWGPSIGDSSELGSCRLSGMTEGKVHFVVSTPHSQEPLESYKPSPICEFVGEDFESLLKEGE